MRGRMRQRAEDVLIEGLKHPDGKTAQICGNALIVLKRGKTTGKRSKRRGPEKPRFEIREIPGKSRSLRHPQRRGRPDDHASRRRPR